MKLIASVSTLFLLFLSAVCARNCSLSLISPGAGLPSASHPGARYGSGVFSIPKTGIVVVCGRGSTFHYEDVWRYDVSRDVWEVLSGSHSSRDRAATSTSPGGFAIFGFYYDSQLRVAYMYGGASAQGLRAEVWRYNYDQGDWTLLSGSLQYDLPVTSTSPGGRTAMVWFCDQIAKACFSLFGWTKESGGTPGRFNDMWKFSLVTNTWHFIRGSLTKSNGGITNSYPGARNGVLYHFDAEERRTVMYGGIGFNWGSSGLLADVWEYSVSNDTLKWIGGPSYGRYSSSFYEGKPHPKARSHTSFGYSPDTHSLYVYGGSDSSAAFSDTWVYHLPSNSWENTDNEFSTGTRFAIRFQAMVYYQGAMLMFGGRSSGSGDTTLGNLWKICSWDVLSQFPWTLLQKSSHNGIAGGPEGGLFSSGSFIFNNTFHLFGGSSNDTFRFRNDLWKTDMESGGWKWISGRLAANASPSFEAPGGGNLSCLPGGRQDFVFEVKDDAAYLYGGQGVSLNGTGSLGDLWKLNLTTYTWEFFSGSSFRDNVGKYGPKGLWSQSHFPAARFHASSSMWENLLLVYGGDSGSNFLLGDLWAFSPRNSSWKWITGEKLQPRPVYSNDTSAHPGGCRTAGLVVNPENTVFYLFGGVGYDSALEIGFLSDVWSFDLENVSWQWKKGSKLINTSAIYTNTSGWNIIASPGSRSGGVLKRLGHGMLLMGGKGFLSNFETMLSDVWYYSFVVNLWVCLSKPDNDNAPEERAWATASMSQDQSVLVLFGGSNAEEVFGDFWKYDFFDWSPDNLTCEEGYEMRQSCFACRSGRYSADGKVCIGCTSGKYAPSETFSSCLDCSLGRESVAASSMCTECQRGKYSPRLGSCQDCPLGNFTSTTGATRCESCALGSVTLSPGTTSCFGCPVGKFASTECETCARGRYNNQKQQTACTNCPEYSFTKEGFSSCEFCSSEYPQSTLPANPITREDCFCAKGFYGVPYLRDDTCKECIESGGVSCPENSSLPLIAAGYFRSTDPTVAYRCVPAEACLASSSGQLATECAEGYTGPICSNCVVGQYYRADQKCKQCSMWAHGSFYVFFIAIIVGIYFLIEYSTPLRSGIHAITLGLFWLQCFDLLSSTIDEWHPRIDWIFRLISIFNFNFDLLEPECSFGIDYWTKWHLKMATYLLLGSMQLYFFAFQEYQFRNYRPYIFDKQYVHRLPKWVHRRMAQLASVRGIGKVLKDLLFFLTKTLLVLPRLSIKIMKKLRPRKKKTGPLSGNISIPDEIPDYDELYPYRKSRYVYAFGHIVMSCYVMIAKSSLELLQCRLQANGKYLMHAYPAQECFDAHWFQMLFTDLIFSAYAVIGVPVYVFQLLLRHRDELSKDDFRNYYGSLVVFYKPSRFQWPVVEICFKFTVAVITMIVIFYWPNGGYHVLLAAVLVYTVAIAILSPYDSSFGGRIALCWAIFFCFSIISGSLVSYNRSLADTLASATLLALISVASLSIISVWIEHREQASKYVDKEMDMLLSPRYTGIHEPFMREDMETMPCEYCMETTGESVETRFYCADCKASLCLLLDSVCWRAWHTDSDANHNKTLEVRSE